MRVKVDKSLVMEVESVQLGVTDDRKRTTILFKELSSEVNDPYIEFVIPNATSIEESEKICEPLLNDLLEKGYADFSVLNLEIM